MPVQKEPKLGLIIDAAKEWLPTLRVRARDWFEACREEPALIWHTPAVRYGVYIVGGIFLALLVRFGMDMIAPGGREPVVRARTADFHVVCTKPECGRDFVINRKFKFNKFPVTCMYCSQETGQRAMRCHRKECRGGWVAPELIDDVYRCPLCNAALGRDD